MSNDLEGRRHARPGQPSRGRWSGGEPDGKRDRDAITRASGDEGIIRDNIRRLGPKHLGPRRQAISAAQYV